LIADALYQTGHIERLGTGLEDLFKDCRKAGLAKPRIEQVGGWVHITIYRNTAASPSPARHETINDAINDAIKSRPGVKKVELVRVIGKSKPTIERAIALLKQQGRIEYRGSKKTGGYFSVS
jgi:ATP-dependent DNA helicase RecG